MRPPASSCRCSIRSQRLPASPLSTPSAAEGGGRRPAFTGGWQAAILDDRRGRLTTVGAALANRPLLAASASTGGLRKWRYPERVRRRLAADSRRRQQADSQASSAATGRRRSPCGMATVAPSPSWSALDRRITTRMPSASRRRPSTRIATSSERRNAPAKPMASTARARTARSFSPAQHVAQRLGVGRGFLRRRRGTGPSDAGHHLGDGPAAVGALRCVARQSGWLPHCLA